MKKDTKLAQFGRKVGYEPKTVNVPLHRASTVLFDSLAQMRTVQTAWDADEQVPTYGVFNMPQELALANAAAELEGGYRAATFSSGLAAITGALLACVKAGDHVLMTDSGYAPGRFFATNFLSRFDVTIEFYDPMIGAGIEALMKPNTKVIYTESPGSHTFEVQDIPALVKVAHAHGALVIMDNAWATGYFFNAFSHGVDMVVQPATKYYAAHSDVLIGLVIASKQTWPLLKHAALSLGQRASPDDCFLALRGLRTLGVRLRQHQASALAITQWLAARPEVQRVLYPALPGDPGYTLWQRDFSGASGLFGVELKPCAKPQLAAMLDHYTHFGLGYSWGGFESLVAPANIDNARSVNPWRGGPLVRYHVGLEDTDDLIRDLEAGFHRFNKA